MGSFLSISGSKTVLKSPMMIELDCFSRLLSRVEKIHVILSVFEMGHICMIGSKPGNGCREARLASSKCQ